MVSRQESGTLGEGRPGRKSSVWPPWIELMFMVERRAPSGTTGMRVRLRSSAGNSSSSKAAMHRAHVAHGAVAEERHRAMRDLALGLDLGPPDAAMAEADAILVERLGNDDVVDAGLREVALARQVGDAAEAAGFLVGGARKSRSRRENPGRPP